MSNEEAQDIMHDPNLAARAQHLTASAPTLMDPAFRLALRAELTGEATPQATFHYAPLITPVGEVLVVYQANRLRLITGGDEVHLLDEARRELGVTPIRTDALPPRLAKRILAAIAGKRPPVDEAELAQLTPFQRAVLAVTRRIPRGEVRS
jgi:hypothetical protein